jgi:FtsH-binding integral membrane protein
MNDATRDRWNRLRVAPLVWLTHAADALATLHRFLRVFFRLSLGLWLILLGCWWWSFLYSAAMYEAEHRLWATFFCPAPKIAVHAVCNVLTLWATARDVLPHLFLIWPSLLAIVGGLLLVLTSMRAASETGRWTWWGGHG